jgi:hypothetical protein
MMLFIGALIGIGICLIIGWWLCRQDAKGLPAAEIRVPYPD